MWRTSAQVSGTNNVPLGPRRRDGASHVAGGSAAGTAAVDLALPPSPTAASRPRPPSALSTDHLAPGMGISGGSMTAMVPLPQPGDGNITAGSELALSRLAKRGDIAGAAAGATGRPPARAAKRHPSGRLREHRWSPAGDPSPLPPTIPTVLPTALDARRREAVALHLRIHELGAALRSNAVVPPERTRSPSPEPVYGADGRRVNTTESRYRRRAEHERHQLIERAIQVIPDFRPPADYRRPTKIVDKVYIPIRERPDINFKGQLMGPRGRTQQKVEADTGAKISLRGRGSVKDGTGRTGPGNEEEDLHCLITADSEEKVAHAKRLIETIIAVAMNVSEQHNDLKRNQLRELAALNGTLRDDENLACLNCGALGHKRFECPERPNLINSIICHVCGGAGHIARDCPERNGSGGPPRGDRGGFHDRGGWRGRDPHDAYGGDRGGSANGSGPAALDSEYANLMAAIDGQPAPAPPSGDAAAGPTPPPRRHGSDPAGDGASAPPDPAPVVILGDQPTSAVPTLLQHLEDRHGGGGGDGAGGAGGPRGDRGGWRDRGAARGSDRGSDRGWRGRDDPYGRPHDRGSRYGDRDSHDHRDRDRFSRDRGGRGFGDRDRDRDRDRGGRGGYGYGRDRDRGGHGADDAAAAAALRQQYEQYRDYYAQQAAATAATRGEDPAAAAAAAAAYYEQYYAAQQQQQQLAYGAAGGYAQSQGQGHDHGHAQGEAALDPPPPPPPPPPPLES